MKKIVLILVIAFLMPISKNFAQQKNQQNQQKIYKKYQGKIIDKNNNPIVGATIISIDNKNIGTASDLNGDFSIKLTSLKNQKNVKVNITSVGYQTKMLTLLNKLNTIQLVEDLESLEEVIVSASREAQKRKYIPAAIGLVTEKDIEESKAFGIEQLVNQVPGVYMSTSMAASNEQHMMAIRTPISTKSLFLYLEDGLPIRPVAVFNHNALLEMNSTAFGRVEVVKGPASSIYGSEAIGGSINFITKNPRKEFGGSFAMEANTLGLQKVQAEVSTTALDKHGFYVGVHKVRRVNGLLEHSDYEKFAITFKNVNDFSQTLRWTNTVSFIDFRSDMGSSSLSEENYLAGKYKSNHTFAEREATALRFRTTLDKTWNDSNKTSFNFIYRNNEMNQIPSYRMSTRSDFGEINSNKFTSAVALVQHKLDFNFADASLIVGGTVDYSPQDYYAKKIKVNYDKTTKKFTDYQQTDLYKMFYQADILNYAGYAQFEISPLENLKVTAALRYDGFNYDYDNKDEGKSGVKDQKVSYNNVSPKIGMNFNITNNIGFYSNYSKGFTPPQVGSLFRNSGVDKVVYALKPANFDNYEVGGYVAINSDIKLDVTAYRLDGKNRLVTTSDASGNYLKQNAGKTRSQGIELGVNWKILNNLTFDYNASYATHKYLEFYKAVKDKKTKAYSKIDHSNTDMPTAPNYIASMSLKYTPIDNLLVTFQHEQIGAYNTSLENEAIIAKDASGNKIMGTSTYDGHQIFNLKANYTYKKFDVWAQGLNIFDTLYSTRASYRYGSTKYGVGAPRAFHFGVKYNF
ncbi:TonB-dependent receptor [Tenacibaculum finnmarkense]|uniref:TonB-dependent receptor n=1 Tax=Tenacibaculum finnmarkense genomovar ulcerans TaxID=2781388 RepID=A0A2I2LD68_9FLAO|nr:TonB-dependent receptor [Tenacibaculum finnmarkense]MBE7696828.1 TonB-dependent receptor [Tenacibaculum finnmarkense genomovar ulcerans]SOS58172.1 TonB-dependent receptor [Tenacibaculum finnmarkense genomovar ulcerans]